MSKKQSARSSKAFTPSTSSGVGGFGGFGGFDTASTFSSASASQLSYVTPPPDLKGISDSSVVVLFKNLSKKDDTTKSKALEDLQAVTDVEDTIIAAWVRIDISIHENSAELFCPVTYRSYYTPDSRPILLDEYGPSHTLFTVLFRSVLGKESRNICLE
jgi:hypothetical protein